MIRTVRGVDLYAGGGGASHAFLSACLARNLKLDLLGINHDRTALATWKENHPGLREPLCQDVATVDPRLVIPSGKLDVLIAGPECTGHSPAAGGRPKNPQSRATAWDVLKWPQEIYIGKLLIENVPAFKKWGPLGADLQPIKSRQGETFNAFLAVLKSLGYRYEVKELNSADYGDPQTRIRLFIYAVRGHHKIEWPEPTHAREPHTTLFGYSRKAWKSARDYVIDHSVKGKSIFTRPIPLRPATHERIFTGLEKFGGPELQPFLLILRNHQAAMSIEGPVPTITGSGARVALIEPKVIPAPEHHTSFLLHTTHGGRVTDWERPSPAITGARRGELGIVEGFLLPQHGGGVLRPVTQPAPTVAGGGAISLVTSCLTKYHGTSIGAQSLDEPIGVIDGNDRHALVESFLYANDPNHPEPAPWQRDPSRLVRPVLNGWALEILYRMLLDYELAAAQSFPRNYVFMGNREKRVKQIGNAWPGELAMALCGSLVNDLVPARSKKRQEKAA